MAAKTYFYNRRLTSTQKPGSPQNNSTNHMHWLYKKQGNNDKSTKKSNQNSSIVIWGYQDNFKPVYFFTKKSRAHKKHQNAKQTTLTLLEACAREKLLP